MDLEKQLMEEIKKWSAKLDNGMSATKPLNQKGIEFLTNIKAYQSDSLHFFGKKDYVRAFEALLWAWAYLTIAKELELLS